MTTSSTPLLPVERSSLLSLSARYFKFKFCVSSKSAWFILLSNFAVLTLYNVLNDSSTYMQMNQVRYSFALLAAINSIIAVLSSFAGVLTDVRYNRHCVVLCGSYGALIGEFLLAANTITSLLLSMFQIQSIALPYLETVFFQVLLVPVMVYLVNALQFGLDQLHDSPTTDVILYIHWYVWGYYISVCLEYIVWSLILFSPTIALGYFLVFLIGLSIFILLTTFTCVVQCKKKWFYIEPYGSNPYKLVFRVVRFACQHKVALKRSAFTYCEDDLPSRLDLGKTKYGGPFTTTEVEDVKAFLGILKVLLCIGPAFMLQKVMHSTLMTFSQHSNLYFTHDSNNVSTLYSIEGVTRHLFLSSGLLSPLIVVVSIPFYLFFIRPKIAYHIPSMLKRINLAIVFIIISLAASLAMDLVVHERKTEDAVCMFRGLTHVFPVGNVVHNSTAVVDKSLPLYQNAYFFTFQHILSAITNMLMDIAVLEFTCSQSPYSMKGLALGFYFSIRALIEAIVVALIFPYGVYWHFKMLSCGSGFYVMSIGIGVLELVMFTFVARRYKFRNVNEPSNVYRYAEEYYSNIQ